MDKIYHLSAQGTSAYDLTDFMINESRNASKEDIISNAETAIQLIANAYSNRMKNLGMSVDYPRIAGTTLERYSNPSKLLSTRLVAGASGAVSADALRREVDKFQDNYANNEVDLHNLNNILGNSFILAGDALSEKIGPAALILSSAGLFIKEVGDLYYSDKSAIMAADDFFNMDNALGFGAELLEDWSRTVYSILPDSINPWLDENGQPIYTPSYPQLSPIDPLSLDLDQDGKIATLDKEAGAHFDLDNSGFAEKTAWVSPEDGLLVLDRNGDGRIDGGAELFGMQTRLNNGELAKNGFEALKTVRLPQVLSQPTGTNTAN